MKLAVFDLDYTIWQPEMYQLYSPPKLKPVSAGQNYLSPSALREARTIQDGHLLMDSKGSVMRVFEGASFALSDIQRLRQQGHDIRAAIASKTDEPKWARICMKHLVIGEVSDNDDETFTLHDCFEPNLVEISYGSKVQHIQRLHKKTGIPYEDICFFDNEHWNVKDVSKGLPDVKCYYTPNGMTKQVWEQAKLHYGL